MTSANQLQVDSTVVSGRMSSREPQRFVRADKILNRQDAKVAKAITDFDLLLGDLGGLAVQLDPELPQDEIEDVDVGHRRAFEDARLGGKDDAVLPLLAGRSAVRSF